MNKELKQLEIIEDEEDKKIIEKIAEFINNFDLAMTPIQIENFVLNDVEFPTDYGKFEQSKLELSNRFNQIIDLYYQIQEKKIEIKKKDRDLAKTDDELDRELLELKKEKAEIQLLNLKKEVKKILKEVRVFWKVFNKHPEYLNLSPEEAFKLEMENWAKKTLNMPTIFEERYGKDYMIKALGKENYERYLKMRREGFGFLPREIFEIKQLDKPK